jgi:hypothetical protein
MQGESICRAGPKWRYIINLVYGYDMSIRHVRSASAYGV